MLEYICYMVEASLSQSTSESWIMKQRRGLVRLTAILEIEALMCLPSPSGEVVVAPLSNGRLDMVYSELPVGLLNQCLCPFNIP